MRRGGKKVELTAITKELIMETMTYALPIVSSIERGNYDLIDQGKGGDFVAPLDVDGFVKIIHKITENKERLEK